jgi:hypothetical protein
MLVISSTWNEVTSQTCSRLLLLSDRHVGAQSSYIVRAATNGQYKLQLVGAAHSLELPAHC